MHENTTKRTKETDRTHDGHIEKPHLSPNTDAENNMKMIYQERKRDKKERKTKWGKETERTKERSRRFKFRLGAGAGDVCERKSSRERAPTNCSKHKHTTRTYTHSLLNEIRSMTSHR